jgi:hypothetical protein
MVCDVGEALKKVIEKNDLKMVPNIRFKEHVTMNVNVLLVWV